MASFRDNGLELNLKDGFSTLTSPLGERITIFALSTTESASARSYTSESTIQLWLADASGGLHEITNDWLETKVAETSAKLDYIYPAVSAFMSAGLVFKNSSEIQTISSDLHIIGNVDISAGSFKTYCPVVHTEDISALTNINVFGTTNSNRFGTPGTLEAIVPFFIRSSANRMQPQGGNDPRLLIVGNTKIYNEFKQTDRGLRFTVLNRESFSLIHDEVYDTAGSQFRVTDLAFDMFRLMNDSKHVGILNSREAWETLLWRKLRTESVGMSASSISAAYWNLTIGSLLDQLDRFGLVKAIRAASQYAGVIGQDSSGAGSQYCAIFEGSDVYVDSTVPSATFSVIYPTNRAIESWIPASDDRIPVGNETQRAQIVGWFMKPRQLDITNNIADRSAPFVATPYGRENDATREVIFVNKDSTALKYGYNVKLDNLTVDILTVSFSSSAGMMDLTDHIIKNVGFARIDEPGDAVNVEFSRIVTPVGSVLDFGGNTPPTNWLMCEGSACSITGFDLLFNEIGFNFGLMTSFDITGTPATAMGRYTTSISGVYVFGLTITPSGSTPYQVYSQVADVSGTPWFFAGTVQNITGTPTFVQSGISGSISHFLLPLANGRMTLAAGETTILDISGNAVVYTYQVGEAGGSDRHQLTVAELASHNHQILGKVGGGSSNFSDGSGPYWKNNPYTENTGGSKYHNNMPPYLAFNKIIRYK
jgi:microcystin-dependent protein